MEDADVGEYAGGEVTRLTEGYSIDSHCPWSPNGDWIVFSSNRHRPKNAPERDHGLDPGYFAVYLMNVSDRSVVRVINSWCDLTGLPRSDEVQNREEESILGFYDLTN